jgi:hypothetical protein
LTDDLLNIILLLSGGVAELVDAQDLKSWDGNVVRVQIPPSPPLDAQKGHTYSIMPFCLLVAGHISTGACHEQRRVVLSK